MAEDAVHPVSDCSRASVDALLGTRHDGDPEHHDACGDRYIENAPDRRQPAGVLDAARTRRKRGRNGERHGAGDGQSTTPACDGHSHSSRCGLAPGQSADRAARGGAAVRTSRAATRSGCKSPTVPVCVPLAHQLSRPGDEVEGESKDAWSFRSSSESPASTARMMPRRSRARKRGRPADDDALPCPADAVALSSGRVPRSISALPERDRGRDEPERHTGRRSSQDDLHRLPDADNLAPALHNDPLQWPDLGHLKVPIPTWGGSADVVHYGWEACVSDSRGA